MVEWVCGPSPPYRGHHNGGGWLPLSVRQRRRRTDLFEFRSSENGGGDAMGYVTPEQLYALITLLIAVAGFSATATLTVIRIVMFIINQNNKKK